jgi:hypothetical protein
MTELERRAEAVKATQARFEGKPFDWRRQGTCIHLLRFHAAQMGHKVPTVPRFRSALGAKRALVATGWQTLPALLDSMFDRIPPAFARVGDVMALPGGDDGDGFDGILIRVGINSWLGWHDGDIECCFMAADVSKSLGAWRL